MTGVPQAGAGASARRRRTLVLAESLPHPTLKGGDLRTWQNVNALAAVGDVAVFGLCSNDGRRHRAPALPLASWTASTDPALAAPPPKDRKLAARAWLLDPEGHPSDLFYSDGAAREIAALTARFDPDVVLLEGLWMHRYLEVVRAPSRRTILDCHNVEAAVMRALAATRTGSDLEDRIVRDVLPARTAAIERRAVAAVDQIWVCSPEDARLLGELHQPDVPIAVVPNGVDLAAYDPAGRTARARAADDAPLTLLFPGIFSYRPNALAAAFLVDEIFPRLAAAHAACRLWLVGPMPTAAMLAAAERDARIVVTGAVPDLRPFFRDATVMAVPLAHGGGTHLKVLESFAAGLPVVSTAKGVEGLAVEPGTHCLLADDAAAFVAAALFVRREPEHADRLAAAARDLVAERYAWGPIGEHVRHAVAALDPRPS